MRWAVRVSATQQNVDRCIFSMGIQYFEWDLKSDPILKAKMHYLLKVFVNQFNLYMGWATRVSIMQKKANR